jgi:type I restriction enzyme S subunit
VNGEFPEGWKEVRLGSVLKLVNGFAFKPSNWGKIGLPIIRIQNLNDPDAPFNYCEHGIPTKARVKHGDLLFAWSGTPGTSFGAHIWKGGDAWLNQHIFRVEFDPSDFNREFLRHAININLNDYIAQAHGGAGLAHITKGMFEDSLLRIAPLAEQERILAALDRVLSSVGACQSRLGQIPLILKRFRKSVLAAACSGRLTEEWREKVPDQSIVEPAIPREVVEVDEICETPENWMWLPLESLCDPKRSICYGVIKLGDECVGGVPCLRTSDVRPLRINTEDVKRISPNISERYQRTLLRGGEVLVNVRGTLGGVAVVPLSLKDWNISREVAVVPINGANQHFISFWIASMSCQKWLTNVAKGVAYTGINISDLKLLPVALPSLEEQQLIVRRVESLLALADEIEERYAKALHQAERLAPSLLAKAFRGELVPTEAELERPKGTAHKPAR